jgi:HEAT repeat protein
MLRAALASVTITVTAVLLIKWLNREPEFQGRPLSAWVNDLRASNPRVREEAIAALNSFGPEALPYLSAELTRGSSRMQRAVEGLSKHVPNFIRAPLRRIYSPTDAVVRKLAALQAISIMGTNASSAVPALNKVFREPHVGLSSGAAAALTRMGTNGVPALIAALDDPDFNIRAAACDSLGTLRSNSAPAIPRLAGIVTNEIGAIAASAATTLARIGPLAIPTLVNFLAHTNAAVRHWGAFGLTQMGPYARPALPALLESRNDESEKVRLCAVQALGLVDASSPEVSAALLGALDDANAEVRKAAAMALTLRPRVLCSNVEKFTNLLEDESPEVRAAAAYALARAREFDYGP